MGRFGIQFSQDNNTPFKISGKRHYGSVINETGQQQQDSAFQKSLAWASYYVLVFAALCVFNKPAMASVLQDTSMIFTSQAQIKALDDTTAEWKLRN